MSEIKKTNKRSQITMFIIVAVVIIAAAIILFAFRDKIFQPFATSEFSPIYTYFEDCIKQKTLNCQLKK